MMRPLAAALGADPHPRLAALAAAGEEVTR